MDAHPGGNPDKKRASSIISRPGGNPSCNPPPTLLRSTEAIEGTISTTTASILAILGGVFLLVMAALGHSFGRHGASSGIAFILVGLFRIGKSFFGASD